MKTINIKEMEEHINDLHTSNGLPMAIQNYWHLCPKCNGKGMVPGEVKMMKLGPIIGVDVTCDVCNGKKIISSLTGQPPE